MILSSHDSVVSPAQQSPMTESSPDRIMPSAVTESSPAGPYAQGDAMASGVESTEESTESTTDFTDSTDERVNG
jgi:hypothetical protein